MIEKQVSIEVEGYKPDMTALSSVKELNLTDDTVVMAKADGEFTFLSFSREGNFTVNRYGHLRMDFPALNELSLALNRAGVYEAGILCELYAMEEGRPLKLPEFIHYVKSKNPDLIGKVHIGVWDLITVNGNEVNESYAWKISEVERWLEGHRLAHVLPYVVPKSLIEAEQFYSKVLEIGYEGVVARNGDNIYKVKPQQDVDAVIIGINKKPMLKEQQVTSIKLALMDEDGLFVELSDCASGIDHQLRRVLFEYLMPLRDNEDKTTIYVQPLVVCQVRYTDTFKAQKRKLKYIIGIGYRESGVIPFFSLRHPRLESFREDKKVTVKDLRLKQIVA